MNPTRRHNSNPAPTFGSARHRPGFIAPSFGSLTPLAAAILALLSLITKPALAAETALLSGAIVHTVSGETLRPGHVLVREGKIVSVSPLKPANAGLVIDLSGLHLFPGLIDANTTLGLAEIQSAAATVDSQEVGEFAPEIEAWVSINPDSELIPVARANGITHVNAVPSSRGGAVVVGQSSVFQLAGWTIEDLAIEPRAALHLAWPRSELNAAPEGAPPLREQHRQRLLALQNLDALFDDAAAYAKARAAGSASVTTVPSWNAMLPYIDGQKPVFIHANELRQIQAALRWIKQRRLKAVIVGGRDAWQIAEELAAAKAAVVYESTFEVPADELHGYDVHFSAPAKLHAAGVQLALSLSQPMQETKARNLPYEAAQAFAYGLPLEAALRAITLHPAQILGLGHRLGSIEPGKEATLIAVTGDILDARSTVKHAWIAGKEISLENRHTRLREKYLKRPPLKQKQ